MDVGSTVRFPILEHLFKVHSNLLFSLWKKIEYIMAEMHGEFETVMYIWLNWVCF